MMKIAFVTLNVLPLLYGSFVSKKKKHCSHKKDSCFKPWKKHGIENGEDFEFDKAELHEAVKLYVEDEAKAIEKYGNIEDWNTGAIDDFSELFCSEPSHVCTTYRSADLMKFNGDLSKWDVSRGTSFKGTFSNAKLFNSDLSKWVVDSSIDMSFMFYRAKPFNSDLSKWKVDHVTNINSIFGSANSFNSDISKWDVGRVKDFSYMVNVLYGEVSNFNSDLSKWNVGTATNFKALFGEATNFNSDLSEWNTEKSSDFYYMFGGAVNFNSNISKWNVGRVTSFGKMFQEAEKFNLNLCHWNIHDTPEPYGVFFKSGCSNQDDPTADYACYEC